MNARNKSVRFTAQRRNWRRDDTITALLAELRRLREEMAAMRRMLPPAPFGDFEGESNE